MMASSETETSCISGTFYTYIDSIESPCISARKLQFKFLFKMVQMETNN